MEHTHAILIRHNWYKGTIGAQNGWLVKAVGSKQSCHQVVADWEASTYYLAHGEAGRPQYKVVTIRSLSQKQRDDVRYSPHVDDCDDLLKMYHEAQEA